MQENIMRREKNQLPIVELKGTPYQIGYQHGKILKEEINQLCLLTKKIIKNQEGIVASFFALPFLFYFAKKLQKFIPYQFQLELRGIANGAQVRYEFLLLENFIEEIGAFYYWYLRPFFSPRSYCSAFVMKNKKSVIVGRNLDYYIFSEGLPSLNTLFVYRPEKGHSFLSLSWPGNIGAMTSISQTMALFLLSSPVKKRVFCRGVPEEIIIRDLIQNCETQSKAEQEINLKNIALGQNLLSVTENEAIVVEISPVKKAIRFLSKQNLLTVTNHFQIPEMQKDQAKKFPKPKKSLMPQEFFTLEGSKVREKKLRSLCLEKPMNIERAKEVLDKISTSCTIQSLIFLPREKEFWVAKRDNPPVTSGEWIKFNIPDLLFEEH